MRLAFLGTPDAAVTCLAGLVEAGHDVAVVVTRPDKRRGRRAEPSPSPVKAEAVRLGLRVVQDPETVLDASVELGVVVAYGRIIRPPLLGALPLVNVHFSLLPRWRGAAPVERAILAGDEQTGVCLMAIEAGLDTGAVYRRSATPIDPSESAAALTDRLAVLGRDLLVDALRDGLGSPVPQEGEATVAAKLDAEDRHIDWSAGIDAVLRTVRVGRAWTSFRGQRLLVLEAARRAAATEGSPGQLLGADVATSDGTVRLVRVQPEGRTALDAADWVRGARPGPADVLGAT